MFCSNVPRGISITRTHHWVQTEKRFLFGPTLDRRDISENQSLQTGRQKDRETMHSLLPGCSVSLLCSAISASKACCAAQAIKTGIQKFCCARRVLYSLSCQLKVAGSFPSGNYEQGPQESIFSVGKNMFLYSRGSRQTGEH